MANDTGGNVAVDFVWGNFPMQPNDQRGGTNLTPTLDSHNIVTAAWNSFPAFTSPNTTGTLTVPNVVTQNLATATATLTAAGFLVGNVTSTAGGGTSGNVKQQTPVATTVATAPYSGANITVDLVLVT